MCTNLMGIGAYGGARRKARWIAKQELGEGLLTVWLKKVVLEKSYTINWKLIMPMQPPYVFFDNS